MKTYLKRHMQVLFATFGDIFRTPVASLTTIVVIAIGLLLPAILYIFVQSAAQLSNSWQGQPQFSVFLQKDLDADEAQLIFDELRLHPAIELAEFISPAAALAEFKSLSGMDINLNFLGENPLPASVVVLPSSEYFESAKLEQLRNELTGIEGIDEIRMDLEWTDRFNAMIRSVSLVGKVLSAVLGTALILIVGITIRLLISNRRQEIEITKLVGGSNQFVRRPFLYFGALFGLFGGFLSLALLALIGVLLTPSLQQLAQLYQRQSLLYQPSIGEFCLLILAGAILGWLAARVSVAQHLGHIKPK